MAYNLKELFLPGQEISDVSPLRELYQLDFVALEGNKIENVCSLAGLGNLEKLLISGNHIKDVGCLYRLTSLTDLLADSNQIEDISALSKLPIKWLNIADNPVTDISAAASMNSLRNLYVDEEKLSGKSRSLIQLFKQSGISVNEKFSEAGSNPGIAVMVNGDRVLFERAPVVEDGTTLVQFRPLFEKLGFTVHWNEETQTVQAEKESIRISLQVNHKEAAANGKTTELEVASKRMDGSVFVPIRFVGESSGYGVTWASRTNTIHLMPERSVVGRDGSAQITVSGKWLDQKAPFEGAQAYLANGGNRIMLASDFPETSSIKTLQQYEDAIKDSLSYLDADFSTDKMLNANGKETVQFSYSYATSEGLTLNVVQTLIKGQYAFYRIVLVSGDSDHSEAEKEYQHIIQTFRELKPAFEQRQEKFGSFTPQERLLDAAHYYREAGFFQKDKDLTGQQFDDKFLKLYKGFVSDDWNPFDFKAYDAEFADLYVLMQDKDRVWLEDTEADVAKGSDSYVRTLRQWSEISRGAFQPTNIVESWDSEEGPLTVSFTLAGKKRTIHPLFLNDFIDTSVLVEINNMISDTGYQFASVQIDQGVFVTVLTAAEKSKLEKQRFINFDILN